MLFNLSRSFDRKKNLLDLFISGTREAVLLSIRRVNERSWNERTRVGEGSRDTEASTRSCVYASSRGFEKGQKFRVIWKSGTRVQLGFAREIANCTYGDSWTRH